MHETPDDLARMQDLLDRSYARAGSHLTSIHSTQARVTAAEVAERLDGMQILVVATATKAGAPRSGPVDGFMYQGRWVFGTAENAVRARHLARSPLISATHVQGEALVVTVHGTARRLDLVGADSGFVEVLRGHYGGSLDDWGMTANPYFAIEPEWMFAADMSVYAGNG